MAAILDPSEIGVLVVDDDPVTNLAVTEILKAKGFGAIDSAINAAQATHLLKRTRYDAIITDWLMPGMDGTRFIQQVRQTVSPAPYIMMYTTVGKTGSRQQAIESGADDFVQKPVRANIVVERLLYGVARARSSRTTTLKSTRVHRHQTSLPASVTRPHFEAVVIAASTGGPEALHAFFSVKNLPRDRAYFVALHGPDWLQHTISEKLSKLTTMRIAVAMAGEVPSPGRVYFSPGDVHMMLDDATFELKLQDGPPENFVRPSADPLFRSAARWFGSRLTAIVLTGLGRDGAAGAQEVSRRGGRILVQDPTTATARFMPEAALRLQLPNTTTFALHEAGTALVQTSKR